MNKMYLPNYNLSITLLGGQSFSWHFDGENYFGSTQDRVIHIIDLGRNEILWQTYPQNNDENFIKKYFRLDVNYNQIIRKIQKDEHINTAMKTIPDIRILKQDFDLTLLSFILSSNNNIKAIRKSIRYLSENYGEKISIEGKNIFTFPKTNVIANLSIDDLKKSRIGYRAKFLKEAAQRLHNTNLKNHIENLDADDVKTELLTFNGIGDKVSDCIMVFSLMFDNITPLDVWAKKVFINLYGLDPKMKYNDMQSWINEYFEGFAAWAGQFLFEWVRIKS